MTALRPARARRAFREWVIDPIVGIAGSLGVVKSPSAVAPDALRRGLEQGEADYRQWKADNPAAAARWEAWCDRIVGERHRE